MWNLKNKINEQTNQKQTHRYKEQIDGCQVGGGWGMGKKEKGIKTYRSPVIKIVKGCKVQHREYS